MKARVINGTVKHNGKNYGTGDVFDATPDEVKRLIGKGIVEATKAEPVAKAEKAEKNTGGDKE